MSEHVAHLTSDNFDKALADAGSGKILIDFWAEWCGPCKMIAPILDEIASEHPDAVTISKLNVDDHQDIGMRYQVMSLPTMLLSKTARSQNASSGPSRSLR